MKGEVINRELLDTEQGRLKQKALGRRTYRYF